jgi:alkanesulfonate monooxygenase SsuD/methylene tetrahydromethanopterin reductase-like flavin-dependent oxidoreductase (luciferase family)
MQASMQFDVFFSICQTRVADYLPDERTMLRNFFDQAELADELGYGTAWIAETHLSCEVQKRNPKPVIPHFEGEIGLNTDILQIAHKLFARTKRINIGSAIRNILCNGGPIAHAEAIRTFLLLHGLDPNEKRRLEIGFAAGRFEFSNIPYGIRPRNDWEASAWPVMKGKIFHEAVEIFLRLLKGEVLASRMLAPQFLREKDFRSPADWQKTLGIYGKAVHEIPIAPRWDFDDLQTIPKEAPLELLRLTIGSHDPEAQKLANKFLPCGVFNLSITPADEIEKTHARMKEAFNREGGDWTRTRMPRTVLIFANKEEAQAAIANYWRAMEGTLDEKKVESAVYNALVGPPEEILRQIKARYNSQDRLMLWFDFNNHDNEEIMRRMRLFMEKVAPYA